MGWSSEHEGLRLLVEYARWPATAKREEYEHRNLSFTIQDGEQRAVATGTFVEWEFNFPPENWVEDNSRAGVPLMQRNAFVPFGPTKTMTARSILETSSCSTDWKSMRKQSHIPQQCGY